jgi:hypothetical protein
MQVAGTVTVGDGMSGSWRLSLLKHFSSSLSFEVTYPKFSA